MPDTGRPDRFAWGLRFGCGGAFGVVFALLLVTQWIEPGWRAAVFMLPIIIACGLLATRYGDKFWALVIDSIPWG